MHKVLIFALLLFPVPASGQLLSIEENKAFHMHIIRAQGWKCDEVDSMRSGKENSYPTFGSTTEIKCKNGKAYYLTDLRLKAGERSLSICHKGLCKKLN